MSNKLLLDEQPLIIQPSLAVLIGLNEALFLQQLHYWLQKSSHRHDGRRWVYNTYSDWQAQFPFMGINTIRRVVNVLTEKGLVLIGNYNQSKIDRTKWYSIDYEKLDKLPSAQNDHMDCGIQQSSAENEQLDSPKPAVQECSLGRTIPEITTEITTEKDEEKEEEGKVLDNPILLYQNNIGTMSPIVLEDMNVWIDDPCFDDGTAIVCEAIRTAARNAVYRWKYIDSILRDWSKRKLRTVEQVRAQQLEVDRAREQKRETGANKSPRNKPMLQDKLPGSVQRQLAREEQGEKPLPQGKIIDDPELKEMLEALRNEKKDGDRHESL
ncbi:DnaD domain protein [Brevibacterium sp. JNUCC-42]|nr:DnaD domain protein [Brevibacterium sp. JNUCC-42]